VIAKHFGGGVLEHHIHKLVDVDPHAFGEDLRRQPTTEIAAVLSAASGRRGERVSVRNSFRVGTLQVCRATGGRGFGVQNKRYRWLSPGKQPTEQAAERRGK
jgi:hypothetical protein